ncbi:hypothetical protein QQ054_10740 [Oscillatoria amoena NRMC-F 0135]|nr:hypothetical protein [Oscillatoria amoena NRMC-F 0135]
MAKRVTTWCVVSELITDSTIRITLKPSAANERLLGWDTQLELTLDKGDPSYNHFEFGKEYEVFVLEKLKVPSMMPLAGAVHIDNK